MSDARIAETWLIMLLARVYTREESAARRAVAALQLEINIDDVRFKQSTITITERSANARFPKCHAMNVLSFFASTYFLGDSGASLSFPHRVAHNCPAAFRSAANEASDITSVKGLPLKGTAP